jgi:hypothetical protein
VILFECVLSFCLVVEKLGLVFPKCRSKRKYGSVGFDYGKIVEQPDDDDDEDEEQEGVDEMDLRTGQGHEILSEQDKSSLDKLNKQRVNSILDEFNLIVVVF